MAGSNKNISDEQLVQQYCDAATALRLFAQQGRAAAQCELVDFYRRGLGVAVDDQESDRWREKAAEGGSSRCQYVLASIQDGLGNQEDASKWFENAAKLGNLSAQIRLARRFSDGKVAPKNLTEATK